MDNILHYLSLVFQKIQKKKNAHEVACLHVISMPLSNN